MFVLVGSLLSIAALIENIFQKKINTGIIFKLLWILLTMMLICRYGQGTDYHGYELMYENINPYDSLLVNSLVHGEYGWYLIMAFSKKIGMNFYLFNALISFTMMYMTYKSIKKFVGNSLLAIILLYPTFYLTYYYSAMRQGLTLSIFLFWGVTYLFEKQYTKYFLLVLILCQIHKACIALFLIPFGIKFVSINRFLFIVFGVLSSIVLNTSGLFDSLMGITGQSYSEVSISYLAVILRIVLYLLVLLLHTKINKYKSNPLEKMLFNIYTLGFIIYISLSVYATLSQRLTMPFKAIEVLLLPLQISILFSLMEGNNKVSTIFLILAKGKRLLWFVLFLVIVCDIEFIKNLFSYIEQGNYYEWVNPLNYPYISVFEEKDSIFEYIKSF